MIKLVIENEEKEIAHATQLRNLNTELKKLAANMMRISRGAGRPDDIFHQCLQLLHVFEGYHALMGHYPTSNEITNALKIRKASDLSSLSQCRMEAAKDEIVLGALQVAASKLLNQKLQIGSGENQLFGGIREVEGVRSEFQKRSHPDATPSDFIDL